MFQENATEEEHAEDNFVDNRPSMKLLESIFEQGTESSESKQEKESNEPTAVQQNGQIVGMPAHMLAPTVESNSSDLAPTTIKDNGVWLDHSPGGLNALITR